MDKLFSGNIISIIAGVLILVVLLLLAIFGISYAFSVFVESLMWIIWGLAVLAYIEYKSANLKEKIFMSSLPPIAIIVTLIGLVLLAKGNFLGLEIIVLGYILEPIAGISLFLTMKTYNAISAYLFFIGAIGYTIGLPLYLIKFPYLAILGDVVKLGGLAYFVEVRKYEASN